MDTQVQKTINAQINEEMFSAYLYLAIAQWAEGASLKGFAHWFKKQSQEELEHAMKLVSHLNSRGVEVKLTAIDAPSFTGKTALAALEASLAHEKHITKKITTLFELAREKKDYASFSLLQWFVDEQVEEEENVTTLIASLKNAGESKTAVLFLDGQMGKRE